MSTQRFALREMQPSDSPALVNLITEFDGDLTTHFLVDPYKAITCGTEEHTRGVVVECSGVDGLVGMGTVRFSRIQFNDEVFPLAFLDGLKVRKEFRGNGLGYQIASWRIQKAREEYGDQCVIGTGMLHDNHASQAVARKWCREFAESAVEACFVTMLRRKPRSLAGIQVREIDVHEYEEFAHKQNTFYRQYNLYPPSSPSSIAHALGVSVEDKKPNRFIAAVDRRGNLVAGAQTWARGLLKSDRINRLPLLPRLLNRVFHLLPADLTLRDVAVSGLWYEADQIQIARHVWEMLRWIGRDQGTMLTAAFDSRDPARSVLTLQRWNPPPFKITLALHGPAPLQREQLLFAKGRV